MSHEKVNSKEKISMMRITLILFLLFVTACMSAQENIALVVRNINQLYAGNKNLTLDIHYNYYEDVSEVAPNTHEPSTVKIYNENRYQKIGNIEVFKTKEYKLNIYHTDKKIVFAPVYQYGDINEDQEQTTPDIQLLKKMCTDFKHKKLNNEYSVCTFEFDKGRYTQVDVEYLNNSYKIHKLRFYINTLEDKYFAETEKNKRPYIEIIYNKQEFNKIKDTNCFRYDQFINKVGERYTLKEKYKDYEFINQFRK